MKRFLTVAFCFLIACSFAACNPVDNESATQSPTTGPVKTADNATVAPNEAAPEVYDGTLPLVDELTTLTFVTQSGNATTSPVPSNDLLFYQLLEEKTNVHIEFEVINHDVYAETLNARLASGTKNLPDLINLYGIMTNHADLEESGAIIDQTELYEKYAYWTKLLFEENPDTFGQFFTYMKNPNGKLYALQCIRVDYRYHVVGLLMNKYWLEAEDLQVPETLDDFTDVLKVFRDNDMDGDGNSDNEIPVMGAPGSYLDLLAQCYGLEYGPSTVGCRILDDGSVQFEAIQPEFKEFLAYMNMLYTEGLISKDYLSNDWTQAQEFAGNNTVGVVVYWQQGATTLSALSPLANDPSGETPVFIPIPPLEGPHGDRVIYAQQSISPTGDSIAISGACQNPELAMKWIDFQFANPEVNVLVLWGQEGVHHNVVNGEKVKINAPEGQTWLYWMAQQGFFQQPRSQYKDIEYVRASMTDWWMDEVQKADPFYDTISLKYGSWILSSEQNDKLKDLGLADLNTYVNETKSKFITGEMSLDEFDAYVAQVQNMNLQQIMEIYAKSNQDVMNR